VDDDHDIGKRIMYKDLQQRSRGALPRQESSIERGPKPKR
jgi:hypothetical protein